MRRPWRRGKASVEMPNDTPSTSTQNDSAWRASALQRQLQEGRDIWTGMRVSRKVRLLAVVSLLAAAFAIVPTVKLFQVSQELEVTRAAMAQSDESIGARLDALTGDCTRTGECKSFPFLEAEQLLVRYASDCFYYSSASRREEQLERLLAQPGGESCGWSGAGAATPREVVADSTIRMPVKSEDGTIDPDRGVVGVNVKIVGQPEYFTYAAVVRSTPEGLRLDAPGALFSSPPTFASVACAGSISSVPEEFAPRLQSMEAGRVNAPSINPNDYLGPNLSIARFGPSITNIEVLNVSVCDREGTVRRVIAKERYHGPVPGSSFEFNVAYELTRMPDSRWYVTGWGPTYKASAAEVG